MDHLEQSFLVMNGDVITNLDYSDLFQFHKQHKALLPLERIKRISRSISGLSTMESIIVLLTTSKTLTYIPGQYGRLRVRT